MQGRRVQSFQTKEGNIFYSTLQKKKKKKDPMTKDSKPDFLTI